MDTRQLKFFVACAQAGSISEAARKLYATQSTVSKAIKGMEETMGIRLFDRQPRGITLTAQGRQVYQYACKIVNDMNVLESFPRTGMTKWIRISLNPSSWFADQFVQFYNENEEKNYHYQIYTAGVETVMDRMRDYLDDVGFVYVFEQQKAVFDSELLKRKLNFTVLQKSEIRVYPGKKSAAADTEMELTVEQLKGKRLIQNYQDEFLAADQTSGTEQFSWKELDVAVVTNSDYIMDKMLKQSDIYNISGSYLSLDREANYGKRLNMEENQILFGYITRKDEVPEDGVMHLIHYLEQQLAMQ